MVDKTWIQWTCLSLSRTIPYEDWVYNDSWAFLFSANSAWNHTWHSTCSMFGHLVTQVYQWILFPEKVFLRSCCWDFTDIDLGQGRSSLWQIETSQYHRWTYQGHLKVIWNVHHCLRRAENWCNHVRGCLQWPGILYTWQFV